MRGSPLRPVLLVHGGDEYTVKLRAREVYQQWTADIGGSDHELIDATAANVGEALKAVRRLREALETLPFFGTGKVIWFQDCNFLSDERPAASQAVGEALTDLGALLRSFPWGSVRLILTSGKVDKRRGFYRTLEKVATVEHYAELSLESPDWQQRITRAATAVLRERGKRIDALTLAELADAVGPNLRQLHSEVEKLCLYLGDRVDVQRQDIQAVVSRSKQARAFALGDALGERNLTTLLRTLKEELWELELDRRKSEIGILYGLIAKLRAMILAKELVRQAGLNTETDYGGFKAQVERLPDQGLPPDKRFNPLTMNAYVLYRAALHARHYSAAELVAAMDRLLQCNQQLLSSGLDEALILQRALLQIAMG
jgi:DNA polymerase-3 subunit delta